MTAWEFRQYVESMIPWWTGLLGFGLVIVAYAGDSLIRKIKRRRATSNGRS